MKWTKISTGIAPVCSIVVVYRGDNTFELGYLNEQKTAYLNDQGKNIMRDPKPTHFLDVEPVPGVLKYDPYDCCWCGSKNIVSHYCSACDIQVSWSCENCFKHIALRDIEFEDCGWDHISDAKENEEFFLKCKEEDERNKGRL